MILFFGMQSGSGRKLKVFDVKVHLKFYIFLPCWGLGIVNILIRALISFQRKREKKLGPSVQNNMLTHVKGCICVS